MKSFFWEIYQFRREVLVEAIGTFILVFTGTGAIMVNNISQGAITHLGISFVFGAVVAALIYSLGHLSGAHFNPAVTLAFCTSGFFPKRRVLPYILAQLFGSILASSLLLISLGNVANLGVTLPLNGNCWQSFILEIVLTFILMFVILGSGLDRRAHIGFAGLAIGLTVALEAAFMGPITDWCKYESCPVFWTCFSRRNLATSLGLLGSTNFRFTVCSPSLWHNFSWFSRF